MNKSLISNIIMKIKSKTQKKNWIPKKEISKVNKTEYRSLNNGLMVRLILLEEPQKIKEGRHLNINRLQFREKQSQLKSKRILNSLTKQLESKNKNSKNNMRMKRRNCKKRKMNQKVPLRNSQLSNRSLKNKFFT